MMDQGVGRLGGITTDGGFVSGAFGSAGGSQTHSQTLAELANHAHVDAGHAHGDAGHTHPNGTLLGNNTNFSVAPGGVPAPGPNVGGNTGTGFAAIQTGFANIQANGSSQAMALLPPMIMKNFILVVE
jgi:hypothetical protein